MKPQLFTTLLTLFILFSNLSCQKKDVQILNQNCPNKPSSKAELFHNSRPQTHYESVLLEETPTGILVSICYSDMEKSYIGQEKGSEIIVITENGDQLCFFRNGEWELRMYVVNDGYQPEDIEWTFYKNTNTDRL